MSNTLTLGRKAFTWAVVVTTIAWAMSAAFIAIPLTAKAATVTAGDLIRGTVKSPYGGYPVYYYGSDGKRHLFPTASTYASWFGTDFSAVKVMTEAEVGAISLGGNVFIRPGSRLVKEEGSDPKVYAVSKGGSRRHVTTEAIAVSLFGAEWSKGIVMIPTGFFSGYTDGAAINAVADYDKAAALAGSPDVGTDLGLSATPSTPTPTGSLSAAMASDAPAAAVIPAGSTSASVMKFNVTAGSSASTITSASFRVVGVGSSSDFTNVYLFDGAVRLTSGRTVASQTRTVEFNNLGISVGASATKMLTVVVDVSTTATSGDTHAFELTSLGTTASVAGLPLRGNTMSIGSQSVSTVTLQRGTDPSGPTIGQKNVPVGELRLTAGTNDVELRRATVTVGGTVSISDLSNFELWQGSTKLAGGTVSSDRVTFDLSGAPYTIPQGANRLFMIKVDVGGRGGRTITTYIDSTYPTDLLVVDRIYGFGAAITFTSFAAAATASATPATGGSFVTTVGGRTTFAFNGPPAADVSRGSQDVTLYKYSVTAGEQAVEVRKTTIALAGTAGGFVRGSSGTRYFTDIKIKNADTGQVLMGPKEHASANSATTTGACGSSGVLSYTDTFTVNSGQTLNLVVTADTANAEDAVADAYFDNGYTLTLCAFDTTSIREVSTGQYLAVTDIVGGSQNVAGNTMTVRSSQLTVSMASTPVSGSTVRGLQGVNMAGFAFTAGTSSNVKVTQLVLTGEGNDTLTTFAGDGSGSVDDLILSASIWDGTTKVGTTKSPTSTGTITFDNLSWTIPAGQTKKLVVQVNLATTLLGGSVDYVYLALPAANVTSQDVDSNSITAAAGTPSPSNTDGASNYLTVNSAGTMTVALDGDTPLPSLAVSGATGVAMTRVKFTASREAFLVKKVRVVNTSSATSNADSSTADDMIGTVKLSYKKQDGTTGTATGVLSNGIADISGLDFYVANDRTEVLTITADMADLNVATGRTAVKTPRLGLDFGISGDTNFEAVGVGSSSTLSLGTDVTAGTSFTNDTDAKDSDVTGYEFYVVKSKPTITLSSASPSGSSLPGNNEVLRFTIGADASGDIELGRITFKVNSTRVASASPTTDWNEPADSGNTGTALVTCLVNSDCTDAAASVMDAPDFTLFDSLDQNTQLVGRWRLYDSTGADLGNDEALGFARFDFSTARTIAAGTTRTYILKVDTTGAATGSSPDTFRVDIQEDTSATLTAGSATARGSSFAWGETSSNAVTVAITSSAVTAGITGYLVKNLPVVGGTFRY